MKRFLNLIITFLLLFSVFSCVVSAENESGFEYIISGSQALIQGVDDSVTGDVIIPETLGGYPVVSILDFAFSQKNIKSVKLPDTITYIGEGAFIHCEKLEKINIPLGVKEIKRDAFSQCFSLKNIELSGGVTLIGSSAFFSCNSLEKIKLSGVNTIEFGAFRDCRKLESVTLTESLETISESAFYGCISLKSVTIPASVNYIGYDAFSECYSLEKISVNKNNKFFASVDDILYNEDVTVLYQYPAGKTAASYIMPKTVEEVHWGAFSGNKHLKSITVNFIGTKRNSEDSLVFASIFGDYVPSNIETVILKDVNSVPINAFYGCEKIVKIVLPQNLTEIGEYAFAGCTSLKTINIPQRVKTIGDGAFQRCTSLKKITLPKGVEEGSEVFAGCDDIKVVYISEKQDKNESDTVPSNPKDDAADNTVSNDEKANIVPEQNENKNSDKLYKILIVSLLSITSIALILRLIIIFIKKKQSD